MPKLTFSVAALALCVAACTSDDAPETTELGPATVREPVVTGATQRIALQDLAGSGITGEAMITPLPDSVMIHIEMSGGAPESTYGVRLQPGTCEQPGEAMLVLEAIRTGALGNGTSHRSLGEGRETLMSGGHVVAIYAPTADPQMHGPVACAQIPAMQPGAGTVQRPDTTVTQPARTGSPPPPAN